MKFELDKEQIKALYDFANTFDFGDLHDMIGERMTEKEIYQLDCVLDLIHKTFQERL